VLYLNAKEKTLRSLKKYIRKEFSALKQTGFLYWIEVVDDKTVKRAITFVDPETQTINEDHIEDFFRRLEELCEDFLDLFYNEYGRYPSKKLFKNVVGICLNHLHEELSRSS